MRNGSPYNIHQRLAVVNGEELEEEQKEGGKLRGRRIRMSG